MSFTYTHTWTFDATRDALFAALLDAAQLQRWFAESVRIDPRVGGTYHFWGRHTLGAPSEAEAGQRILALEPPERLLFTWRLLGVDTQVEMVLGNSPKGATLALTHSVPASLGQPRERELIDDHWRFHLGNLAMHLAGGDGIVRPDFTDPQPDVRLSVEVDAPVAVVWRTLTDPAQVGKWFGSSKVRIDLRPGGAYEVIWEYKVDGRDVIGGTTRILELEHERQLTLDWREWRGDSTMPPQFIRFTLEPRTASTTLHFVHGGFTRTADLSDFPFGWAYFLGALRTMAGPPPPSGSRATGHG